MEQNWVGSLLRHTMATSLFYFVCKQMHFNVITSKGGSFGGTQSHSVKLLLCNLCFEGPRFKPTLRAIVFREFAGIMTRVQQENEGGSAKSAKCKKV